MCVCVSACVAFFPHLYVFVGEDNACMYKYVCATPSVCLLNVCVCAANELHVDGTLSLPSSHLKDGCMYVHVPYVSACLRYTSTWWCTAVIDYFGECYQQCCIADPHLELFPPHL